MSLARRLARPELLDLPPFDLGEQHGGYGVDTIKLDANENPYPPLSGGDLASGMNRYPEPQHGGLRAAMASLYGVASCEILLTRGGDDAIDLLCRSLLRGPDDAVAVCVPTFSAYAHFAKLQGARVIEAPLTDSFDFSADVLLSAVEHERSLKIVFICSPNNPTGNEVDPTEILRVADALPDTFLLVDEAYLEFSSTMSLVEEACRRPNLLILKTLSKAFGLAGARVGALIGPPETLAVIARALPPYPLATLSIEAALQALQPARRAVHQERIARIVAERGRLASLLRQSPLVKRLHEGGGNFLFLEVHSPEQLAARLTRLGIKVRFRPNAAPGGVRLTVGTPEENDAALAAFEVGKPRTSSRHAELARDTRETRIAVAVDLERSEPRRIKTGVPYYDHMLDQVAAHGNFSLVLGCEGDTEIDAHHTIEDCAIALGQALRTALADKRGIGRFGFALPMDEAEAQVLVDLSGRPFSRFQGTFTATHIGDYPTEMTPHVFRSLADSLGAAIHVRVDGENDHHKVEACFKAFGRALRQAVAREGSADSLPSTKGVL